MLTSWTPVTNTNNNISSNNNNRPLPHRYKNNSNKMATSPAVMSTSSPRLDDDEIMTNAPSPTIATVTRAAASVAAAATVASVAGPAILDRARGLATGTGGASSSAGMSRNLLTGDRRATPRTVSNFGSVSGGGGGSSSSSRDPAHRFTHTQGGRISKNRHPQRPSSSSTASTSPVVRLVHGPTGAVSGVGPANTGHLAGVAKGSGGHGATMGTTTTTGSAPNGNNPASSLLNHTTTTTTSSSRPTGASSSSSSSSSTPTLSNTNFDTGYRPGFATRSSSASSAASLQSETSSRPTLSSTTSTSSVHHPHQQANHSAYQFNNNKPDYPSSSSHNRTSSASLGGNAMAIDDAPVLTFWGPDPVPLPSRFARIKRNLIAGNEAAIEASWHRLIHALRAEMDHIEGLGAHLIPSIEYSDMAEPAQTARFGRDLRRYGVGVVRRAVPKKDADDMVNSTVQYLDTRRTQDLEPLKQDPTCYDFFWTPAQVRARAHPSVLNAQRFMMSLWEASPEDRLATRLPIAYVDRIRIHGAGGGHVPLHDALAQSNGEEETNGEDGPSSSSSSGGDKNGASAGNKLQEILESQQEEPQSADDWVVALQSSAGIIAQVDNGSLERWEPDGYGRTGTYSRVFKGDWESYDPWECNSRVSSTMDLYNGYGACTIFRMFQGVLALSTIEPGMIRLLPSPKLATAYYLLRPFFSAKTPAPDVRTGPEWDAYLDPNNWKLERDPDTIIHGAVPGHAQRITERWHPHLNLRSGMITLPTLQPGDYIFWHPDLPYHISSGNPGLQTPRHHHSHPDPVSMLIYIPAAPLTQTNALYLARQRKAFQRGQPGPDFDSSGRSLNLEDPSVRPGEKEIADVGGPAGLQAMGLAPWEVSASPPGAHSPTNGDSNGHTNGNGTTLSGTSTPHSHAEAEVVRLSNIILFPDRSMMGYSV